jgi:hypothetical protein
MTDDAELNPATTPDEQQLGERLAANRPLPGAGFRGALGRHLVASDPGYGPRPARLRMIVCGYLTAGALLLAVGVLLATGAL